VSTVTTEAVEISLQLTLDQAYALAELAKRIGWMDVRTNAVDDTEAHQMLAAMARVRNALSDIGVIVR